MSASSASKWTPILKGTAKVQAVAWAVAVPAGAAFQMVPQIREMRGLTCTTRGIKLQTNVPLVGTFNQEKALVGTFSVIVKSSETFG